MKTFSTVLGDMPVLQMLMYYDGPVLFICEDHSGTRFVVHLIDSDDTGEKWFMVPSSVTRIRDIKTGRMSLRDSVVRAENRWVWEVTTPYDGSEGTAVRRLVTSIEELDLPSPDVVLNLPDDRLPQLQDDAGVEADRALRDVIFLNLDNGNHAQVIEADALAQVLLRTQGTVTAIANRNGPLSGRIPTAVAKSHELLATGLHAASFGIRLETKKPANLLGSEAEEALNLFMQLLEAGDDLESLRQLLPVIRPRAAARYRFLLSALNENDLALQVKWGTPGKGQRTASLSMSKVRSTLEVLGEEGEELRQKIRVHGDLGLIGVIAEPKKKTRSLFEFVSSEGDHYKGTLDDDLVQEVLVNGAKFQVPVHGVDVEIEEIVEINPSTAEEHTSYVLLSVDQQAMGLADPHPAPNP